MIAHQAERGNALPLASLITLTTLTSQLVDYVHQAARDGTPVHVVERGIWNQILALGHKALGLFFQEQGTGDLGEQIQLPNGSTVARLDAPHTRDYRSVFGDFVLTRTCYGTREGQKIEFVPLDNRLELPQGDYSYLLQEWDAAIGTDSAFARVAATFQSILGIKQSVDSLERNNLHMAASVEPFRESRPIPAPADEGEVFVVSADGKGIVLRRDPTDPAPKAHRNKGDKANKKRMAIIGAIYSVDRYQRTPEEVTAALFRDPRSPEKPISPRPIPVGKHVWGRLSRAKDGSIGEPIKTVFSWLGTELGRRQGSEKKEVVCVMDGQQALWDGRAEHLDVKVVEILDILHVTPRLWQAAHLFCAEKSTEAAVFVRERLLKVLNGEVKAVVQRLRWLGTNLGLTGAKKKTLMTICNYLKSNADRMRYDEYLKKGYPIASGVIEGACRHYVKDRMERAGMRWVKAGAQAMLDVRSEYINGDWEKFQQFRVERETERLYPHRKTVHDVEWQLAT